VNVPVLIPTYNPTERIIEVVRSLISAGFERLIIVDDGSRPECSPIFAALADMPQCTLLHHDVNRGKGRGLKTGFAYILEHMPECSGHLTQAVVYMSVAPKSNALYMAYEHAKRDAAQMLAEPVPLVIRNAPTKLMQELNYGKGYQ